MTTLDVHVATFNSKAGSYLNPSRAHPHPHSHHTHKRSHLLMSSAHASAQARQQPLMQSHKHVPRPGHVKQIVANWPPGRNRFAEQARGPIYRLPREIIAAIFDHYMVTWEWNIHADIHTVSPLFHELSTTLNTLTSVCRLWRHICHTSPRLWRNILHCSLEHELKVEHHFRTSMDRSMMYSMDMWVSGFNELVEVYEYLLKKKAFDRVRSLHVGHAQIATRQDKDNIPWFTQRSLPNLERFSLDYADISMCEFADLLKMFPKLQYLRLLHMKFSGYTDLLPDGEAQEDRVAIPNVKCIELIQEKRDWITQVMQRLVTTNLTCMSITLSSRKGPGNMASITLAEAPWMCISLRKIALGNHLDYSDIVGILQPLLALSHLHLFRSGIWGLGLEETKDPCDDLLAMLHARPGDSNTLVPSLRILSFYCYPLRASALYELILNRRQVHSLPLKTVGLENRWRAALTVSEFNRITSEVDVYETTAYHLHEWQ